MIAELQAEGRRVLLAAGVSDDAVRFRYGADVRYSGQGNEVTVWVGERRSTGRRRADELRQAFEHEYRRIYGLTIPDVGLQVVTWRISAVSSAPEFEPTPARLGQRRHARSSAARSCSTRGAAGPSRSPVYERSSLGAGDTFDGPAIVEERETTVVMRPGWQVEVAPDGSLDRHPCANTPAGR